ncbi:MAG: radical SAM protein [Thermodesulfobacteriota bacterium]|nr:radical SAM protein [Thermodesulfobacteriota bacterium]
MGPHFGEEPPITGSNGSGTIFFTGCSLGCSFCQNRQISREGVGETISIHGLSGKVFDMIQEYHVHNINFVTPDHFFPHIFHLVTSLRQRGHLLPFVYNLSGYQSIEMLRVAEGCADIYLPDYKYSDSSLSIRLSQCKDYPEIALEAIAEMVRQKGFLDFSGNDDRLAKKGVLVRHLILPGNVDNSLNALTTLFLEFGPELPLSLMSQYHPVIHQHEEDLNRLLTPDEFNRVYSHTLDLGFTHLFVQFPDKPSSERSNISPYLPDFHKEKPFPINYR